MFMVVIMIMTSIVTINTIIEVKLVLVVVRQLVQYSNYAVLYCPLPQYLSCA